MWQAPENDCFADEIHLAGELVPPGIYKQISTGRTVNIEHEDRLPGSLDGRVACYVLIRDTWGKLADDRRKDKFAA